MTPSHVPPRGITLFDPTPARVLKDVFGFDGFREHQEEIVTHVCAGGDALVLMPTGSGKSLCYQVPSIVRPGVGIVVSPLIALMQDQVTSLLQLGVRAAFWNSSLGENEWRDVRDALRRGELDLLYVAPERLMLESFLREIEAVQVALFAIDEAHCVSQWGHDFRPEYLQLSLLHERFPQIPRIALTATADPPTRREIAERLDLTNARPFVSGFDRPNIRYRVGPKDNARRQLLAFLREEHPDESGIVYCLSRKRVEEIAAFLAGEGFDAAPYHAGLTAEVRRENQRAFVADEVSIIVATVAFGMGIDKPDVRFVYHLDPPKSLEAYYQETGRAGRDGLPANAVMTYGLMDMALLRRLIDQGGDDDRRRVEHRKLDTLLGFCETTRCRRAVLLEYFGEKAPPACGNCDACLSPADTWDGTVAAQKLLSAVVRTEQRFGQAYLIDLLLGIRSERMTRFGHDRLPTFSAGTELDRRTWQSVVRQLVAAGYLTVDVDGFGGMRLAGDAAELLRGERKIELRRELAAAGRKRERTRRRAIAIDDAVDRELFDALRAKRLELARAQGVPPFVIFADRSLIEMATRRPSSLAEIAEIHGVGQAKLVRYGDVFLEVLAAYR